MFVGSECPPIAMKSNSLYGAVRWSDVLRFSTDSVTDSVTDSIDSVHTRTHTGVAMSHSGRTESFWSVGTSQRARHTPAAPCIVVVGAWGPGVWPRGDPTMTRFPHRQFRQYAFHFRGIPTTDRAGSNSAKADHAMFLRFTGPARVRPVP